MAREQKQLEHSLSQVQRKLKAFEGTEQMHDEMLERALEFAANCFSSYTKASDIQKKMLNQLFFEKVLISSKGEKEHHAHAHLNTWTLIFRTTNVAQNEAIDIEHNVEEYLDLDLVEDLESSAETTENTGIARSEDLAIPDNSLNRMCKNTMVPRTGFEPVLPA